MAEHWQTWLAALLCLAAAAYVMRRAWLTFGGNKSGCGSVCSSCASNSEQPAGKALLTIEPPKS
jgi:hypothetical protein